MEIDFFQILFIFNISKLSFENFISDNFSFPYRNDKFDVQKYGFLDLTFEMNSHLLKIKEFSVSIIDYC